MHVEGTVTIQAPREKVWGFLTDAAFVSQCAPGVKDMEIVVPHQKYRAVNAIGFGSVEVVFKTDVEFQEMQAPEFARVRAHGDAPGGAVDVTSEMFLSDGVNGSTELRWTAEIMVAGRIAAFASRMMGSVTRKLTAKFFDCARQQIEA